MAVFSPAKSRKRPKPNFQEDTVENIDKPKTRRYKGLTIALAFLAVIGLTAMITLWLAKLYLFPRAFQPVELTQKEQIVLDQKIQAITSNPPPSQENAKEKTTTHAADSQSPAPPLTPEPYRETDANRKINLNERELNALLAKNTDLGGKVAIDLAKDMASVKILIPLDPEMPFLGGKTLKVTAGLELQHNAQGPKAILKGVSVWGVPLPNAWMGGMKNADLIKVLGADSSFWRGFSAGIDDLRIEDGQLTIQLAE